MSSGPSPSWAAPDPGQRAGGPPEATPTAPPPGRAPWGWIALAVVVLAVAGVATWLAVRDDSGGTSTPASTTARTTVVTSAATTATRRPSTAATASAPTASTPSSTSAAAPTAGTTAPPPTPPTASSAAASAPPASADVSVVGGVEVPPADAPALAAAQAVTGALASGDWATVRRLSPAEGRTDTQLEAAYGALTDVAIVPARVQRTDGQIDLRLGLVAHEDHASGPATALLCAHWRVDPAAGTVDRISSVRLRLEPGRVDPSTVSAELKQTCATYPLR